MELEKALTEEYEDDLLFEKIQLLDCLDVTLSSELTQILNMTSNREVRWYKLIRQLYTVKHRELSINLILNLSHAQLGFTSKVIKMLCFNKQHL